ncbi:MAG: FixH family protein [Methylocella sp.]
MSIHDALSGDSGRPLTGWRTLGIAAACFGVIFAVNGFMAYSAISTFTGETEPSPYEHGLAYQKDVEAAKAQAALGWNVTAHVARDDSGAAAIEVRMQDRSGAPLKGLGVAARLESPANVKFDTSAALAETAPGLYAGRVAVGPGPWDFEIEATQGGARVFKSENRIALR